MTAQLVDEMEAPPVSPAITRLVRAVERVLTAPSPSAARDDAVKAMVDAAIPLTHNADTSIAERRLDHYLQQVRDGSAQDEDPAAMVALLCLRTTAPDVDADPLGSWRPRNLTDVALAIQAGTIDRPAPTVGSLTGGLVGLFYADRVNAIYGASGNGKTWIAVLIAKQLLEAGETVWWVDFEDDEIGAADRFLDLGLDVEHFARFRYIFPSDGLSGDAQAALLELLEEERPALVVVDSTGEWMGLHGIEGNKDEQVAAWFQLYAKPLASAGAAVVLIDHMPHDSKARHAPIGSQRKLASINGSAFLVTTLAELGRDRVGKARLTTSKDRRGYYPRGKPAAELLLDATVRPYNADLLLPTTVVKGDDGPLGDLSPAGRRVHTALMNTLAPLTVRRIGDIVAEDKTTGMGLQRRTIQDALKKLEEAGLAHSPGVDPDLGGALWLPGAHPALDRDDENAF